MLRYLWLTVVVIVLDQWSKWFADNHLTYQKPVHVMPYFDWFLSYNTGAAFSFLADAGGWQRWFFVALASIISLALLLWIRKLGEQEKATAAALALILGGALGNVIDRALNGHVVDFIQVWLGSYPWPAFNLADSAITLGAIILIFSGMKKPYQKQEQA